MTSPTRDPVTVGLIQTSCSAHPAENVERTRSLADRAAREGAQIVCTQELFRSQYFCSRKIISILRWPSPFRGRRTEVFQHLARERQVVMVVSLFERRARGSITTRRW